MWQGEIMSRVGKIRHKNGNLTTKGLQLGYIQVSPFWPTTHLYLSIDYDKFVVKGWNEKGKGVHRSFDKLKVAIKFLGETK